MKKLTNMSALARKIEKESVQKGEYKTAKNISTAMLQDKEDCNKIVKHAGVVKKRNRGNT